MRGGDTPASEARARRIERVLQGHRNHEPARLLARELGVDVRSIVRYRKQLGIAGEARPVLTPEELDTARKLLEDGCSYLEAARTIRRSPHSLYKRLPGFGFTPEDTGRYTALIRRGQVDAVLKGV